MTSLALLLLWMSPQNATANAEAISSRAVEMAQQRRFDEAERLWKEALQISPKLFSAAFNLGYMYYSRGDHSSAEPYLKRAADTDPKDFNSRYLLGAVYSQMGRVEDALKSWRAALALRPAEVKLMKILAVEYGKARYYGEAAATANRALALQADDPELYSIAIKAHQDANQYPAAMKMAERFVRGFPELPRANFECAYELNRMGRPSEALPYLKKAMVADGTYEEPFFLYGEILSRESKWDEAIVAFRRTLELRRDYMAAWIGLGRALMSAGRNEEALKELLHSAEVDPKHPQPHLLLSQLYFRLGKEDLARQEKELSSQLRRERPETMEGRQGRPYKP